MQTLKKLWNWLVISSEDPAKFSLTIKGVAIPVILYVLNWKGLTLDGNALQQFIDAFVNSIVFIVNGMSILFALYGAGRKVWNTIKKK